MSKIFITESGLIDEEQFANFENVNTLKGIKISDKYIVEKIHKCKITNADESIDEIDFSNETKYLLLNIEDKKIEHITHIEPIHCAYNTYIVDMVVKTKTDNFGNWECVFIKVWDEKTNLKHYVRIEYYGDNKDTVDVFSMLKTFINDKKNTFDALSILISFNSMCGTHGNITIKTEDSFIFEKNGVKVFFWCDTNLEVIKYKIIKNGNVHYVFSSETPVIAKNGDVLTIRKIDDMDFLALSILSDNENKYFSTFFNRKITLENKYRDLTFKFLQYNEENKNSFINEWEKYFKKEH